MSNTAKSNAQAREKELAITTLHWSAHEEALKTIQRLLESFIRSGDDDPDFRIGEACVIARTALGLEATLPDHALVASPGIATEPEVIESAEPSLLERLYSDPKFLKQWRALTHAEYRKMTRAELAAIINRQRAQLSAQGIATPSEKERRNDDERARELVYLNNRIIELEAQLAQGLATPAVIADDEPCARCARLILAVEAEARKQREAAPKCPTCYQPVLASLLPQEGG